MNNNVIFTFCLRKSHAIENKRNSETAVLHDKHFKSSMQHVNFIVYSDPLPSKQFDYKQLKSSMQQDDINNLYLKS